VADGVVVELGRHTVHAADEAQTWHGGSELGHRGEVVETFLRRTDDDNVGFCDREQVGQLGEPPAVRQRQEDHVRAIAGQVRHRQGGAVPALDREGRAGPHALFEEPGGEVGAAPDQFGVALLLVLISHRQRVR
jgi:hypothetical protein